MPQTDSSADVPSPIDFHVPSDAAQWAATAMVKRRRSVFRGFVAELEPLFPAEGRILELASGPGFLARQILFLVCDHVSGEAGMANMSLYMSLDEHRHALREAGFSAHEVRREHGMVLYRAQIERP